MATTVTYKGQVLVTVDNSTKVLETSGTWCEDDFTLVDTGGGGGVFTKLDEIVLETNQRSITINIQDSWRNYDMIIFYLKGEFTASNWLYWNIDATTLDNGKYPNQRKIIDDPYILMVAPVSPTRVASLVWQGGAPSIVASNMPIDMSTVGYLWFSGWNADMIAGTSVKIYGGNYADL